jgi:hypothetical protein
MGFIDTKIKIQICSLPRWRRHREGYPRNKAMTPRDKNDCNLTTAPNQKKTVHDVKYDRNTKT